MPLDSAAAEALAVKALSIAPEKASGHLCLGVVYIYTNRAAQGISEFELINQLPRYNGAVPALKRSLLSVQLWKLYFTLHQAPW